MLRSIKNGRFTKVLTSSAVFKSVVTKSERQFCVTWSSIWDGSEKCKHFVLKAGAVHETVAGEFIDRNERWGAIRAGPRENGSEYGLGGKSSGGSLLSISTSAGDGSKDSSRVYCKCSSIYCVNSALKPLTVTVISQSWTKRMAVKPLKETRYSSTLDLPDRRVPMTAMSICERRVSC